jgi:hypothetical protein
VYETNPIRLARFGVTQKGAVPVCKLGVTRALVSAGVEPGEFGKFIADETEKWTKVIPSRIQRSAASV